MSHFHNVVYLNLCNYGGGMGKREQSYRMGKQELVTHAVGHGFKSQLCKLQGLRKEKTDLRKAHREVTWSPEDGMCCGHASSCRPAGQEGFLKATLPSQGQMSSRSASQGTCPNARAPGSIKATDVAEGGTPGRAGGTLLARSWGRVDSVEQRYP